MSENVLFPQWFSEGQANWSRDRLHITLVQPNEVLVEWKGRQEKFSCMLFDELNQAQLPGIMDNESPELLILARRISQPMRETLQGLGINYLEGNGNGLVEGSSFLYRVDGRENLPPLRTGANRAFTEAGLKVLLWIITDTALLQRPQRQLAAKAGVALGNIPMVLDGLRATGFLLEANKKTFTLHRREELIHQWVTGYQTVLRPRLAARRFYLPSPWQTFLLVPGTSVWGGEPAADLLVRNLNPEKLLLFSSESSRDLILRNRMRNDEKGNLEVLTPFWPLSEEDRTAPPLVVYADLVISGDGRNLAVARQIWDTYLIKHESVAEFP